MTHDPSRLATAEQIVNGNNPFEKIDTPLGTMERWRAEAMLIGTTSGIQSFYQTFRNDAAELEKKTVELDAKKSAVLSTVNKLLKFMSRVDELTTRVEELEAKRKADEAEQRELEEEPLELPPDFDRPQDLPPSKIGDDETHHPSGELHSIVAKEEEEEEPSELPQPPLETEANTRESDAGKVPLSYGNVPTSYVHGEDQAGDLPEELEQGLPEPPPEPRGGVVPQPISVSLNEG
jgi:hypothetical protein